MSADRPEWIELCRGTSSAAQWVRVALQVNPFAYVKRHGHPCSHADEDAYNDALVNALVSSEVALIAVTDHFRWEYSSKLAAAARAAGVAVLPGFEACSSEGVHFLVLLAESATDDEVERAIWEADLVDTDADSPVSRLSALQLLEKLRSHGAVIVGAHVTSENGVLAHLSGMPRSHIWTSPLLRAAAIPRGIDDVPEGLRPILLNADAAHRRERAIAIINAGDISAPEDVSQESATCWLRMTAPTLAGVKQAFMDPESRVRLSSDPVPEPRPVLRAVHWDGGFLDGQTLLLSDQLNVLVGAPGSGKSTVIESLRAAFDQRPHSQRAQVDHDQLCEAALDSTTLSVVVEHPHPSPTTLVIQRTLPHPPVVIDAERWTLSERSLESISPQPEIYGQHEIADLARDEHRRTTLLERFMSSSSAEIGQQLDRLRNDLDTVDVRIADAEGAVEERQARVALLPGREEQLKKWEEEGIAQQLEEETLFQREHRYIERVEDGLAAAERVLGDSVSEVPDAIALSESLNESPFADRLLDAGRELDQALGDIAKGLATLREGLASRQQAVAQVREEWKIRRRNAETRLAETRRKLGTPELAKGFKELQDEVDVLRTIGGELPKEQEKLKKLHSERAQTLTEIEKVRAKRASALKRAAASVTTKLGGRVRVSVSDPPDFAAFEAFARENIKGYRKQTTELFKADSKFSFRALAGECASGAAALAARWKMTEAQARLLAGLDAPQLRRLERIGEVLATQIELNVGLGGDERWRRLEDLSKGQKATAVLMLLLLDSRAPLVIDQPEDDLDNRYIVDDVVPAVRRSKRNRQFILATHNANVPVLADAELVAGLTADGDALSQGESRFRDEHVGSIDAETVKDLVESQLEGGHDAFEERARRYGHQVD